jgi:endonuclease/exonuclease/phosphatase family metal-dependent hydrolase
LPAVDICRSKHVRRSLFGSLAVFFFCAGALHAGPADGDSVFTIATYNVKNLFDAYDDPYTRDERTNPVPKPVDEVNALAAAIRTLNADVLALQEVENRGVLQRFSKKLLGDLHYRDPVLLEGNDARGIDVAILSRYSVGPVTSYRHLEFPRDDGRSARFSRDLLRARINSPGDFWFDVYVVHLKSGSRAGDREKRLSEAHAVRKILDEELDRDISCRFVVLGDFNDGRGSEVIRTIEGEGERRLFCPTDGLDDAERVTFFRDPVHAQLDFIFCSPSMKQLYVEGSVSIPSDADVTHASDHRPVAASFTLPPEKERGRAPASAAPGLP